jgi:hypothetical protein
MAIPAMAPAEIPFGDVPGALPSTPLDPPPEPSPPEPFPPEPPELPELPPPAAPLPALPVVLAPPPEPEPVGVVTKDAMRLVERPLTSSSQSPDEPETGRTPK